MIFVSRLPFEQPQQRGEVAEGLQRKLRYDETDVPVECTDQMTITTKSCRAATRSVAQGRDRTKPLTLWLNIPRLWKSCARRSSME